MRLTEKYRPTTLDEVFGQPPVTLLKALVRDPFECCIMLEGPPGCGKTAAACALAYELGCVDDFSGLYEVTASEFSSEGGAQDVSGDAQTAPASRQGMEGAGD